MSDEMGESFDWRMGEVFNSLEEAYAAARAALRARKIEGGPVQSSMPIGPWFAHETEYDGWYVVDECGDYVAHVGEGANAAQVARLLASAPTLLEERRANAHHIMGSTDDALATDGCCEEENQAYEDNQNYERNVIDGLRRTARDE